MEIPGCLLELLLPVFTLDEGRGLPGKEGYPYKDSNGYWTIGKGHYIGLSLTELKLSENIMNELLKEDLSVAINDAVEIFGESFIRSLRPARLAALTTMLFTLGKTKFMKFEESISLIKSEEWDDLAENLPNTKWARDVDPRGRPDAGRDDRVIYMFRTGEFHPEYGV